MCQSLEYWFEWMMEFEDASLSEASCHDPGDLHVADHHNGGPSEKRFHHGHHQKVQHGTLHHT